MLRRKDAFTIITPIPDHIPRQLAIDILHSHSEVITLNPLVLDHKPIPAPRDAPADEFYCTWYEITERIQFIPGIGRLGSGLLKFNGCFHDMRWGLQTHIYFSAPMNVDLRNTYRIAGNQPGIEPPEPAEIGLKSLGVPADGLYLREDIEIKCNLAVAGYVKAELKKAGGEMVKRMMKKAELLDAGVLHAMIENGRLRTINPADRSHASAMSPLPSPSLFPPGSPQPTPHQTPSIPYQPPRPVSAHPSGFAELPPHAAPSPQPQHSFTAELPGDYCHAQPSLQSPDQRSDRNSYMSSTTANTSFGSPDPSRLTRSSIADSQSQFSSRPTSYASDATGGSGGFRSPPLDHKGFSSELPTHRETHEEHRDEALRRLDPRYSQTPPPQIPPYNPQHYAPAPLRQQHQQYPPPPGYWR